MRRRLLNSLTALSLVLWLALSLGTYHLSEGGGTYWMGWRMNGMLAVMMMIALAVPPALWLLHALVTFPRKLLETHRAVSGLCSHCGYDLWASRKYCPECGPDPGTSNGHIA